MKRNYIALLTAAFMSIALSANSQNVFTFGKGTKHTRTFQTSKEMVVEQKSDNLVIGHSKMEYYNPAKGKTDTYSITVCPQGDWERLTLVSAEGNIWDGAYYNWVMSSDNPEGIVDEVEAGTYEVYVGGGHSKHDYFYSTYLIEVNQNTEFYPSADADAVNEISFIGVDENNESLANNEVKLMFYDAVFHYAAGDDLIWLFCGDLYADHLEGFRFNDLTEKDRISIYAPINVEGQKTYFVEYPAVKGGSLNQGWTVSNNAEEMRIHEEYFAVAEGSDPYYYVNYFEYLKNSFGVYLDDVTYMSAYGFDETLHFNPEEPLTIVTNVNSRGGEFEEGEVKSKVCPCVFQNAPEDELEDKVVASSMYYTADGELVREPVDVFLNTIFYPQGNYTEYFTPSPVSAFYQDKVVANFGGRTPITFYQGHSTVEEGYCDMEGALLFLGEYGSQRYGDEIENIKMTVDDEVMYEGSLFEYNMTGGYFGSDFPFAVNIEVVNGHLSNDGVVKKTRTVIDFDLNREDGMAPTMTYLQVVNEDGEEEYFLPDYSHSHINFTAGDFTAHHHELYGIMNYMMYQGKPNIEVYYYEPEDGWKALEYTEDETMFHGNYGNFFTIDLSQLDASVLNQWVNLKFVVTDEAGNSQTQELSNVFFAGQQTSVNEQTTALAHSVYPNPFSGEVRINAVEAVNGNANVSVFNVLGEQVISKAMQCNGSTEFVIDGSSLMSGIYFYSIATENGKLQGRIVKE